MRLKIRCDGWKRKYFGFTWEVNTPYISNFLLECKWTSTKLMLLWKYFLRQIYMIIKSVTDLRVFLVKALEAWLKSLPKRKHYLQTSNLFSPFRTCLEWRNSKHRNRERKRRNMVRWKVENYEISKYRNINFRLFGTQGFITNMSTNYILVVKK
jgi:hypothetical protein